MFSIFPTFFILGEKPTPGIQNLSNSMHLLYIHVYFVAETQKESTPVAYQNKKRQKLEFSAIEVEQEQESERSEASETIFGSTVNSDINSMRHISMNKQLGQISGNPFVEESYNSESDIDSDVSDSSSAYISTDDDDDDDVYDSLSSSDDDGLTQDQIDEISMHMTENAKEDSRANLVSLVTDLDLTRTYFVENEQCEKSMELETTIDRQPGAIYASSEVNSKEMKAKVHKTMEDLYQKNIEDAEYKLANQNRVLVSLKKLQELKGKFCMQKLNNGQLCNEVLNFESDVKGCTVKLRWSCKNEHFGMWVSSEIVSKSHYADIYLNDLLVTACVLLSGNNYSKFARFCKFLGLAIPDQSVFYRNQRLFFTPVILQMWDSMKSSIITVIKTYNDHILGGDGRNDSPGFCARFCVYVTMELITNAVLHLEVLDKRETGGISTNMEREGLTRTLLLLMKCLDISEITTDASTSIMKSIQELKNSHPELSKLNHCLDIWHAAKNISKKLHKTAQDKAARSLKPWIAAIVNHFWFACQVSNGDAEKLKDIWIGVLHHVCNEHIWAESECLHGPLSSTEPKVYLLKNSVALEKLRSVVLDRKLLSNLSYYSKFRHTGMIENFNSMLLKYASKRNAYDYPYFKTRMALAAIDHNIHLNRPLAITKDGKQCFKRKYNKNSRKFTAEPVKEQKSYSYIPYCLAKIVVERKEKKDTAMERLVRVPNDPKLISPTLDLVTKPPPTSQLVAEKLKRIKKKK
ncbi:uncharacterized protein LOC135695242 [Rhopilema esculentum]|uniref:uncharacterized protein LOC135695242 n=1 Tax=Rhopilema esculentum TaxID=499914 RepID=UPI0031E246BF